MFPQINIFDWSDISSSTQQSTTTICSPPPASDSTSVGISPASDSTSVGIPSASTQYASASASTRYDSLSATTASDYYGRSPYSSQAGPSSSDTQAGPSHSETHGIYEDHPGLNPSSEQVVEKQSEIHEIVKDLIRGDQERVGASDDQIMAVAENIHGESGDVPFLEDIVRELTEEGIMSDQR